jgi:hypothetical protein
MSIKSIRVVALEEAIGNLAERELRKQPTQKSVRRDEKHKKRAPSKTIPFAGIFEGLTNVR